jgi:hypothetical protein
MGTDFQLDGKYDEAAVEKSGGTTICEWGSGFGVPYSVQECILAVQMFCLQKAGALPYSATQKKSLTKEWALLVTRTTVAAEPSGEKSVITKLTPTDSKSWPTIDSKEPASNIDIYLKAVEVLHPWYLYLDQYRTGLTVKGLTRPTEDDVDAFPLKMHAIVPHLYGLMAAVQVSRPHRWSAKKVTQWNGMMICYREQISRTLFHWNIGEFYALLDTAVKLNVGIICT